MPEPLKVLIVDDSRLFRCALEQALDGEPRVVVSGSVWNGAKALEQLERSTPDVVTLDLEMPGLSGLETLRAIRQFNTEHPERPPVGVLVVSVHARPDADITRQARAAGALDCLLKPTGASTDENLAWLKAAVVPRLLLHAGRRSLTECRSPRTGKCAKPNAAVETGEVVPYCSPCSPPKGDRRAILVAASTGGPRALLELLPELCDFVEQPIFVVQHIGESCCGSLATALASRCSHRVVEAEDSRVVEPRTIYIAPADHHLLVRPCQGNVATFLNQQPKENNCRPAADVLFRSAAVAYGGSAVAVVLTGMDCDGREGLRPLKRAGAYIIAQDEATSVVWGMPRCVVEAGLADAVLPLPDIAVAIRELLAERPLP